LQLSEVVLENWGPFYETHSIELDVTPAAPVVLFRAENGRGKTSLLRAIVWCLYGAMTDQDGTPLDLDRMVNVDALQDGDVTFGVSLRFTHKGAEYVLHRSGIAVEDRPGKVTLSHPTVDLKPAGGQPFPTAQIPEIIDGILSREISDFFFFDGEMLNSFEKRLRDDQSTSQGFVRAQVERALGLPFMTLLASDLDVIQSVLTTNLEVIIRKTQKHAGLSEKYLKAKDELQGVETDLVSIRTQEKAVDKEIVDLDAELAKVDQIKDLFFERKNLEDEVAKADTNISDLQGSLARQSETHWWIAAASKLKVELGDIEAERDALAATDRQRYGLQFLIEQVEKQLSSGVCSSCGQPTHDEDEKRTELKSLKTRLAAVPSTSIGEVTARLTRLRPFGAGAAIVQRIFDLEQDLRRAKVYNDRRKTRISEISERISDNTPDIGSLERNLVDKKDTKRRISNAVALLEEKRTSLKASVQDLGSQIANQPEVDETERRLQKTVSEAQELVAKSYDSFRQSMRQNIQATASDLFMRLTTEPDYTGISISDDYLISVLDHDHHQQYMVSAGVNQILTTAFIGALGECSVEEAPLVMDTPMGRLDIGHRSGVLKWVSTFTSQVILFVQSGEYDPDRDASLLAGKIGREYTIDRLTERRSEVKVA
jgi:DNA sulfur modification protein DndD